jgi:II/X family phage/plasmid replication protein
MITHMLDWATVRVPCFHPVPIDGGRVMKLSPEGVIEWEVASRLPVVGSHESSILIRTYGVDTEGQGIILEISGNPTKWLQGHNLFGGFLAPGPLVELLMYRLCEVLPGLQPTDLDLRRWRDGHLEFLRVDVNTMFALGTPAAVRAWLRGAEYSAYMRHRGKGTLVKEGTLYFGQGSKRWSAKFYSKGDELAAGKGHGLPKTISEEDAVGLEAWAGDKLRFEVMLRSKEIQQRGLRWAFDWSDTTGAEILKGIAEGLQMSDNKALPTTAITDLPKRLVPVYYLWQQGHDIRAMYPKPTFYRYRKELLSHGIDIGIRQPHEDRSNVVPLIRVIEAIPCGPPAWAYGTPLLVGPADLVEARRRFQAIR